MGLKASLNLFEQCTRYAKVCGKEHILQTMPQSLHKINPKELKLCSKLLNADSFISSKISFSSKDEIIRYFESLGIKADVRDFSDAHLQTFSNIAEQLKTLQKYGITDCEVDKIILSDWRKTEEIQKIIKESGLTISFPYDRRAYCGANSRCIFINSSEEAQSRANGVFKKFNHEVGHIKNYNYKDAYGNLITSGANSVLGQGVKSNTDFCNRQLKLLGIDDVAKEFPVPHPYSVSQGFRISNSTSEMLPLSKGNYQIDIKKMVEYMNKQCKCYNNDYVSEQVAEIFEDLLKGRTFDDLTMLMYDFNGGARIPNLAIKGQKYDDYIKSLYSNKELVNELKQYVKLSKI